MHERNKDFKQNLGWKSSWKKSVGRQILDVRKILNNIL
jgi:hypothetical protein